MKMIVIALLLSTACVSVPLQSRSLTYNSFSAFEIGKSKLDSVISSFGTPSIQSKNDRFSSLEYYDPEWKVPRLIFNFDLSDNTLSEILWLPREYDSEKNLEAAKKYLKMRPSEKSRTR